MKKKCLAMLLAVVLAVSLLPGTVFAATAVPTQQEAYQAMIAMKSDYPEGMTWTNDNFYAWKGGIYSRGYGCAGFAFLLSDAAFGDLRARMVTDVRFSDVRVGDILRINDDTHSVIILEVRDSDVVIAEGNYGTWTASGIHWGIHWGRILTKAEVEAADYMLTRYPVETVTETPAEPETPTEPDTPAEPETPALPTKFTDIPASEYYTDAVIWALEQKITNGTTSKTFSPAQTCTEAQILTMLWRAEGKPTAKASNLTVDSAYQKAVDWAYEKDMIDDDFDPNADCDRATAVYYIWMARGSQIVTAKSFKDVEPDADYADAVSWAVASKITKGTGSKQFSPDKTCERGMIVTFLYRAYK